MLVCVERRFKAPWAPHPIPWRANNGSAYAAREPLEFATALAFLLCFKSVLSLACCRFGGQIV